MVVIDKPFGKYAHPEVDGDPSSLTMPSFALAEVTDDERFTGARLALTTHSQVKVLLDEFNVK